MQKIIAGTQEDASNSRGTDGTAPYFVAMMIVLVAEIVSLVTAFAKWRQPYLPLNQAA